MDASNGYTGSNCQAIACGDNHTAILTISGEVLTFGFNSYGQLGDNTNTTRYQPVEVDASNGYTGSNCQAIACGTNHTAILTNTGKVLTFGSNGHHARASIRFGQLGIGNTTSNSYQPVEVDASNGYTGSNCQAIACGYNYTAILTKTGKVLTFGYNRYGQLGDNTNSTRYQPVEVDMDVFNNLRIGDNTLSSLDDTLTVFGNIVVHGTITTTIGGHNNTAIGEEALYSNATGTNNTAIGHKALYSNRYGDYNTAIGNNALYYNTDGIQNTAIGHYALSFNTDGDYNTGFGRYALYKNTDGIQNTAIGDHALYSNTTGDHNIAIGYLSGPDSEDLSNTICIGQHATVTQSNQCRIGNDSMRVGIGTSNPKFPLQINGGAVYDGTHGAYLGYTGPNSAGNGNQTTVDVTYPESLVPFGLLVEKTIWAKVPMFTTSDERIKTNIEDVPDDLALEMVRNIPCRYYEYKDKNMRGNKKTIGFIAQEVKEILPMAVTIQMAIIPNEMRILENITWETITDGSNNRYKLTTDLQDVSGIIYRFYVSNDLNGNDEHEKEIKGNSDNTFTFKEKWDYVYCYGKEVNDLNILDKQRLFTLNFSATQEIDRIQQQEKTKVQNLQTELSNANNIIQQQAVKITTLEGQLAEILTRLSNLEK